MSAEKNPQDLLCPSAPADGEGARVIGIVQGSVERPHVEPLRQPIPITPELLQLISPAQPGEVFRIAAGCAGSACKHYVNHACALATKIAGTLPEATERLPVCAIRDQCRWFFQEGADACRRCPQVVRTNWRLDAVTTRAADPRVSPQEAFASRDGEPGESSRNL